MEKDYSGKGYLKGPLNALRDRLAQLNDSDVNKCFQALEFNINELGELISEFQQQLKEGCMLLLDGKIFWANKAALDITGYTQEELTGKPMFEMTVPDMRDKMAARIKMLLAGDAISFPEEWPLLKGDRTVKYINIFAYRVKFLNTLAILVFFYDITREKMIADERKMQAEMMDSINDGVFLLDLNGKIIYVNQAFCNAVQYSKAEISNMNILEVTAPELRRQFEIKARLFSEHKEARFSTVSLTKDGKRIPVEVRGKIVNHGGKQRLLGVARTTSTGDEADLTTLIST